MNVKGVAFGCKYGVPAIIASGGGSIVNVASFVAWMGAATSQTAYTASKGAVLAMTREIAVEYARRGVRCNALCPGPIETPLLMQLLSDDAKRQRRFVHIPMGRLGRAEELAKAALFLASDDSSFMTGASLHRGRRHHGRVRDARVVARGALADAGGSIARLRRALLDATRVTIAGPDVRLRTCD